MYNSKGITYSGKPVEPQNNTVDLNIEVGRRFYIEGIGEVVVPT